MSSKLLVENIIEGILEVKGREIMEFDLSKVENAMCDKFIICHAESGVQVNGIAESITKRVKEKLNLKVDHREGIQNAQWILLEYGNLIIHIFQRQYREYYKLEELWGDAKINQIEESFN